MLQGSVEEMFQEIEKQCTKQDFSKIQVVSRKVKHSELINYMSGTPAQYLSTDVVDILNYNRSGK